ncbi:cupin domain-containing protein [Streptomyces sp. PLK6-54]|uniref:Cupin domain-containing protein n=1 Tax=Actinacidiphila acidipaludis TaxID=2873382 RepID=A0ABS7QJ77_9ACTN|nr:cupin domain-containing protein [Streptomyces acidipaludis]
MTDEAHTPECETDPAVSVVGPGEGETIVLGSTRMRVLEDGSHTGHRLAIAESVLAPHTEGPPQHRHAAHDEGFYMLSGTVSFTVGETEHDAPAGTFVIVPPGSPHTFANRTDQPAVMLSTFTPDFYVQYFRDLQELGIAGGGPLSREDGIETMRRYATESAAIDPARPRPIARRDGPGEPGTSEPGAGAETCEIRAPRNP